MSTRTSNSYINTAMIVKLLQMEVSENIPIDKIPSTQLQQIAEHLYDDRIKEGDGKLSAWEFQVLNKTGLLKIRTRDKGSIREERYEAKVSRTVLKTSGNGDISA